MSKRRRRELLLLIATLFILWQVWNKIRIVIFVPMPWWALILLIVAAIVVLDLILDRLLGDHY